jgi:hypothetical protein
MALQLDANIVYTLEEYRELFKINRLIMTRIKESLLKKGIQSDNNFIIDLENFIFNSIKWEIDVKHFNIYKRLVKNLSYNDIFLHVAQKRTKSIASVRYNSRITEIIIVKTENIMNNKYTHSALNFLNHNHFPESYTLCSCHYNKHEWKFDCPCCNHIMMKFADHCISDIGSKLLIQNTYQYLLFLFGMKDRLINDVVRNIGIIFVDLL